MTHILSLDALDANGKRVLLRVDFNVPVKDGVVTDDTRIRSSLPTIQKLVDEGARVVILSHLGRPQGIGYEEDFSQKPSAQRLSELLGKPVGLAHDIVGPDARAKVAALKEGEVLMLENLRFDSREKKNDPEFCQELASLGDVFVSDAFGAAHRNHASIAGVPQLLPAYAGYLLEKEVSVLSSLLHEPVHPFVAVLGGSKVSDKIQIIDSLLNQCDTLIIGGGMCFTFLAAQGFSVGKSLKEDDWIDHARSLLDKARARGVKVLLPTDVVIAQACSEDAEPTTVQADALPETMMGLDIGPETCARYAQAIHDAQTVFWNGPMGVFEINQFANGTYAVASALAANELACTVIGGGDSIAAVNKCDLADKMTFISTGGGASMRLIEGKKLPGVEMLKNKHCKPTD